MALDLSHKDGGFVLVSIDPYRIYVFMRRILRHPPPVPPPLGDVTKHKQQDSHIRYSSETQRPEEGVQKKRCFC